jgi:hypothetical protein
VEEISSNKAFWVLEAEFAEKKKQTKTQVEGVTQLGSEDEFISIHNAQDPAEEESAASVQKLFHTSLFWYENLLPGSMSMATGTPTYMATPMAKRTARE